ncbi:MAG: hypothetical protein M3441_22805 [Chloroflexota bacterium]|nr:hypothetical protein [Chloroflexota bacterium]
MGDMLRLGHNFSDGKRKALQALLVSRTIAEAADKCGMHRNTIHRYLAEDEEFARAYREARETMMAEAVTSLRQSGASAAGVLANSLEDEDVNVRLRAARTILDQLFRGVEQERRIRETEEIEREIKELREMVEAEGERRRYGI